MPTTFKNNRAQPLRCLRSSLGAAWRRKYAQAQVACRPLGKGLDDSWLSDFCRYWKLRCAGESGTAKAEKAFPALFAAEQLNGDPGVVATLKLMVVGGLPRDEIAQRIDTDLDVVAAWEKIHFDIREVRDATDWLASHVIAAEQRDGNEELAAKLRIAIGGGAEAARAILDLDDDLPCDQADRLFVRRLKLHIKFDQAMAIPLVDDSSKMRLVKLHADIQISLRGLELESQKLVQKCIESRNRFELAKMQVEAAAERRVQRAAAREARAAGTSSSSPNRSAQEAVKALYAQESADRVQRQSRADQLAAEARVAASPLSELTWAEQPTRGSATDCRSQKKDMPADKRKAAAAARPVGKHHRLTPKRSQKTVDWPVEVLVQRAQVALAL
jgi:hypothetical protein